jgi:hypothetical protein
MGMGQGPWEPSLSSLLGGGFLPAFFCLGFFGRFFGQGSRKNLWKNADVSDEITI